MARRSLVTPTSNPSTTSSKLPGFLFAGAVTASLGGFHNSALGATTTTVTIDAGADFDAENGTSYVDSDGIGCLSGVVPHTETDGLGFRSNWCKGTVEHTRDGDNYDDDSSAIVQAATDAGYELATPLTLCDHNSSWDTTVLQSWDFKLYTVTGLESSGSVTGITELEGEAGTCGFIDDIDGSIYASGYSPADGTSGIYEYSGVADPVLIYEDPAGHDLWSVVGNSNSGIALVTDMDSSNAIEAVTGFSDASVYNSDSGQNGYLFHLGADRVLSDDGSGRLMASTVTITTTEDPEEETDTGDTGVTDDTGSPVDSGDTAGEDSVADSGDSGDSAVSDTAGDTDTSEGVDTNDTAIVDLSDPVCSTAEFTDSGDSYDSGEKACTGDALVGINVGPVTEDPDTSIFDLDNSDDVTVLGEADFNLFEYGVTLSTWNNSETSERGAAGLVLGVNEAGPTARTSADALSERCGELTVTNGFAQFTANDGVPILDEGGVPLAGRLGPNVYTFCVRSSTAGDSGDTGSGEEVIVVQEHTSQTPDGCACSSATPSSVGSLAVLAGFAAFLLRRRRDEAN